MNPAILNVRPLGDTSKPEGLRALRCLGQDAGGRMSFMVGGPSIHQGREQRLAFLTMVPEQAPSTNKILELFLDEFLMNTSCAKC